MSRTVPNGAASRMEHLVPILFLFALGACVGSFLNVVAYRLPRVEDVPGEGYLASLARAVRALSHPPSTCPTCRTRLAWRDNVPVLGWLLLRGRCRTCGLPISPRYPIVEAITGAMFAFYYVAFFVLGWGPCGVARATVDIFGISTTGGPTMALPRDAAVFAVTLYLLATLLAVSLIDAETYHIPLWLPWLAAAAGAVAHAFDRPGLPGSLIVPTPVAALAGGAGLGLVGSILLLRRGVLRQSFADGAPPLEVERDAWRAEAEASGGDEAEIAAFPAAAVRAEMRHEMLFLMPPLVLGVATYLAVAGLAPGLRLPDPVAGVAGALLGALVGGGVVWLTRILGSYAFGREAMGLGDVHLMFGVGAGVGAGAATVAFFLAPFFGLATAAVMLIGGKRRELPYGPYLSLATAAVLLFYCPIAAYLAPGVEGLGLVARSLLP